MRDWVDEAEIIAKLASDIPRELDPVLVDVGAADGSVTSRFLGMGWSAIAYEPDPANRRRFERNVGRHRKVQLSSAAVSDKPAKSVTLFTSPVSSGVSTLAAFHNSHKATATVDVVTLSEDLRTREVDKVNFLKVDVEGFDFLVLKGFDWHLKPRFVMYEFEDHKTVPLGYSLAESSSYVAVRGYSLVFSVWDPIVEYGTRHRWRGLFTAPPSDVSKCWGNVLCFSDPADAEKCMQYQK